LDPLVSRPWPTNMNFAMVVKRETILKMSRFALVGSFTAIIYLFGYNATRAFLGIPPALAAVASYVAAISFQYIGHAAFTFRKSASDRAQFVRFLVLNGIGLLAAVVLTVLVTELLGAADWVSSLSVVVALPLLNWIVMHIWVFR